MTSLESSFQIINSNKNLYNPDTNLEKFINYTILPTTSYHGYINYSFVPLKLKQFNDKIVSELASYYKIHINIIKVINHNLMIDILNSKNIITDLIQRLSDNKFFGLHINYEKNYRIFNNKMNQYINNFLNNKDFYEVRFYQTYDEYNAFVDFIFSFYKYKCYILIDLVNFNSNKIISINNKVNKILNFVSFLKQKKNTKVVTDFVYRRINEYEQNKIILQYYDELKELELYSEDIIDNIFLRHDLRQVTFNILGNKFKINQYNKNDYLSFIYKILNFSKTEITSIKREIATVDLIKNKVVDINFIFDIIYKINSVESEINYLNYNIRLYVHRQKIIQDYSKYLKTLYNSFVEKVGNELSDDIFHNLIINKKYNSNVMRFIYSVIKTRTEDLILL